MISLDANASTPLDPRVREAMIAALDAGDANPSSLHPGGRQARALIERAREQVATALGARPTEIVFTSGGTEANVTAIRGVLASAPAGRRRLVTSRGEHPSVAVTCRALAAEGRAEVIEVGLDRQGRVDQAALAQAITPATALVTLLGASNEVGTLQDLAGAAERARSQGAVLHVDAVQMLGKVALPVELREAPLVSLSAHKVHGPKGVGALVVRRGVTLAPLLTGGAQESGRRAGTENLVGIVGFGVACTLLGEFLARMTEIAALRDRLEAGIAAQVPGAAAVIDPSTSRLPGTSAITFARHDGAALLIALGHAGIACSLGSACSLGKVATNPVLTAMGLSERAARATLRFSLAASATAAAVDEALATVVRVCEAQARLARGGRA